MLSNEEKKEKKKNIAKSTCELFVNKGYVNITISEIAKVAGVGKGTIYEYFKNKDEIVFELMGCLQENYDIKLHEKLVKSATLKEKVFSLFEIYLSNDDLVKVQREIYKEYLGILISNKNEQAELFNTKMISKYSEILQGLFQDAIDKKEIKEDILRFIPSIFATLEGFFITNKTQDMMREYLDALFKLFELNKKEIG